MQTATVRRRVYEVSLTELNAHSYPRELAEQIWSLWGKADSACTVLDSIDTLHSFLSVAYQASLLREEGRPVECRIALSAPKDLESTILARIGFHLVRLAKRRKFAEQEIRRLAPATGFYRSMILAEWSSQRGFEISGMIHTGALSRDLTAAVDSINHPIPDWLIIHVRGPGNLVINRGSERLVTLLNGRVEGHGFDLLASTWLRERYRNIGADFADENPATRPDLVVVREDLVEKTGFAFMRRVIREIRNSRHGGTMVFVPRILTGKLLEPSGPLSAKYRIEETCTVSPFAVILAEVRRRLVQFAVAKGKSSVGWREYLEWFDELPFTFSQRFVEFALWLSDLTAVDGCLLLDLEFNVLGFGVEIQVPSFEDEMVYRALDIEAQDCVLESMEAAGTRHRTAYRLCREYSECLAVVVSQDGAVKFVANHQDKVTYWNHLDF